MPKDKKQQHMLYSLSVKFHMDSLRSFSVQHILSKDVIKEDIQCFYRHRDYGITLCFLFFFFCTTFLFRLNSLSLSLSLLLCLLKILHTKPSKNTHKQSFSNHHPKIRFGNTSLYPFCFCFELCMYAHACVCVICVYVRNSQRTSFHLSKILKQEFWF